MAKRATHQYTLRDVPAEVDRILRQRARERRVSLNRVILDELIAVTVGRAPRADFSDLVGGWPAEADVDAALAEQRRIEPDLWS